MSGYDIRIRPGRYTRAILEAPSGERLQTPWFRQGTGQLRQELRYIWEEVPTARVVYLLNAIVPERRT
jgi:hypothetical protein